MGEEGERREESFLDGIDCEEIFLSYLSRWQRLQYKARRVLRKLIS